MVHEARPLLARKACGGHGIDPLLLSEPGLPGLPHRLGSGLDRTEQVRRLRRDQHDGRRAVHDQRRAPHGRPSRDRRRAPEARDAAEGGALQRRRGEERLDGHSGQALDSWLRLRDGERQSRFRPRRPYGGHRLHGRPGPPRLRAPREHHRQQPYEGRSDPSRSPSVRVGLVRQRQGEALARPHRPTRLLRLGDGRSGAGSGHARPGRPRHQGEGTSDGLDLPRCRLLHLRRHHSLGGLRPEQRLRYRELDLGRREHFEVAAHLRSLGRGTVHHAGRPLALLRPLYPPRRPGRTRRCRRRIRNDGRGHRLGHSVHGNGPRVPGRPHRTHEGDDERQFAAALSDLPQRVWQGPALLCADARLVARLARQFARSDARRLPAPER